MARLFGAQRKVLQAVHALPKDAAGYVTEIQIAQSTQIIDSDARDGIETLEGEGFIEVAHTTTGLSASITAKGRLALNQSLPLSAFPSSPTDTETSNLREPAQPQRTAVIDASGNWALLGDHFFDARSVKQRAGILTIVIPSEGPRTMP